MTLLPFCRTANCPDVPLKSDKGVQASVLVHTPLPNLPGKLPCCECACAFQRMLSALAAGESCLALPKLNLQFLTAHDYLLRNFSLFRLEATYEIREDLSDVLARMGASWCALPADCFQVRRGRAAGEETLHSVFRLGYLW